MIDTIVDIMRLESDKMSGMLSLCRIFGACEFNVPGIMRGAFDGTIGLVVFFGGGDQRQLPLVLKHRIFSLSATPIK